MKKIFLVIFMILTFLCSYKAVVTYDGSQFSPFVSVNNSPQSMEIDSTFEMPSSTKILSIKFSSPDGREAWIDFSGDKIVYSGDLSVDESAKLFFEALKVYFPKCPE